MRNILFIIIFLSMTLNAAANNKDITLQLSWFDQFQFAGYYIAKEKGFYEDEGLNVNIKPFKFGLNIPAGVNNGKFDFAVGRETLILERSKNKKIVALYALFQASPLILISTKESGIDKITDFKNKKIMTTINDASEVSIKSMITSQKMDVKNLNFIKHTHNINDLIEKKTDVISAYTSKSPYHLQKMGIEYNVFAPKEFGFAMYSDLLYTSESNINRDIESVQKFKSASLKGWKYAYENIEETVDLILQKYNTQNLTKEELLFEANELKKLSFYQTDSLGDINLDKLQRIYDLYNVMGLVSNGIDLKDFIFDYNKLKYNLTLEEKEYIEKNIVTIGVENWEPIMFYNKQTQKMDGIGADFIHLIMKDTGLKVKIVNDNWDVLLKDFKNKKIDLLPTTYYTEERAKYGLFSEAYFSLSEALYVTQDNMEIKGFDCLKNKKLAIVKEYGTIEKVKQQYPDIQIVETNGLQESVMMLLQGSVDALFDSQFVVDDFLHKNLIANIKPILQNSFPSSDIHFFSQKDDYLLDSIIEKSLLKVTEQQKRNMIFKWLVNVEKKDNYLIPFTKEEKEYLKRRKSVTICAKQNWLPIEDIKKGKLVGISGDYLNLLEQAMDVKFNIKEVDIKNNKKGFFKENGCDIKAVKALNFPYDGELVNTLPIFSDYVSLITRVEQPFINNINNVSDQTFVMIKGYNSLIEFVRFNYPKLKLKIVNNMETAHDMVINGEVYGFIGTMLAGSYNIQKNHSKQLKVMTNLKKFDFGIGVIQDDTMLLNIINKVIENIPEHKKSQIMNRWTATTVEKYQDFTYILYILGALSILFLLMAYKQYILKDHNKSLKKKILNATSVLKLQNQKLLKQKDELNCSLENFRNLFDVTLEAIIIYDMGGHVHSINKVGLNLFGFKNVMEVKNKNMFDYIPEYELNKVHKALSKSYVEPYELDLYKENKVVFPALVSGRNITKDGKLLRLTTIIDLTEIKKNEELLQRQSKLALMGEMISMIAHQWRQPLNILGAINMKIETKLDFGENLTYEDYLPISKSINQQLEFMSTTIDDFRDFFKPKDKMKKTSFNIIVNKVLNIIGGSIKNKNIELIVQLNQSEAFWSFENELSQVMLNLINNSVDAIMENEIENPYIKITTQKIDDRYILKVKDNGGGIPKDVIHKVFDPYFSTKHSKNGTGIGLYMSKKIIEDHSNGTLEVFNKDDGALFKITLFEKELKNITS